MKPTIMRIMTPLVFISIGIILLSTWLQFTLSLAVSVGLNLFGQIGAGIYMLLCIASGLWLFKIYLDWTLKILVDLGWRRSKD